MTKSMSAVNTSIEELFRDNPGRRPTEVERNSLVDKALWRLHTEYSDDYSSTNDAAIIPAQHYLFKCAVACIRCAINSDLNKYCYWLKRLNRTLRKIDDAVMHGDQILFDCNDKKWYAREGATLKAGEQTMHLHNEFNYEIPSMRNWDCFSG